VQAGLESASSEALFFVLNKHFDLPYVAVKTRILTGKASANPVSVAKLALSVPRPTQNKDYH
jgi:hypothetical protein